MEYIVRMYAMRLAKRRWRGSCGEGAVARLARGGAGSVVGRECGGQGVWWGRECGGDRAVHLACCGPRGSSHGRICVNAVSPGYTDTKEWDKFRLAAGEGDIEVGREKLNQRLLSRSPMQRWASADEIGGHKPPL